MRNNFLCICSQYTNGKLKFLIFSFLQKHIYAHRKTDKCQKPYPGHPSNVATVNNVNIPLLTSLKLKSFSLHSLGFTSGASKSPSSKSM